jgi:S1-C subfamily serine protease
MRPASISGGCDSPRPSTGSPLVTARTARGRGDGARGRYAKTVFVPPLTTTILAGVARALHAAAGSGRQQPGDVVTEFSREPIADVNAVRQRIEQLKTEGEKMVLLFVSPNKGDARLVGLELE